MTISMEEFDKLSVKPDWTLTLPDNFMAYIDRKMLDDVENNILKTHRLVMSIHNPYRGVTIYTGWYDVDRKEGAMAVAPLISEFDTWRRGHRRVK